MFLRVWRYRVARGREREFKRAYGPTGPWAQLFAESPGYLGTGLFKALAASREYLVIDRWESQAVWAPFHQLHAAAYERLDGECQALSEIETLVGEYEGPLQRYTGD